MTRRLSPLGARIALAFIAVAAIAVGALSALTLLSAHNQVSGLVSDEQRQRAQDIAAALSHAYATAGGWQGADLSGAYSLAASDSALLTIVDARGGAVATDQTQMQQLMQQMRGASGGMMALPSGIDLGAPLTALVVVGGATVGTASIAFPTTTPALDQGLRDSLVRTVAIAGLIAVAAALVAAIFVSRRLTRPLVALSDAAAALRAGDRGARVDETAPGELGDLAATFNTMAATLEKEAEVRRALVADVAHELRTPVTILQGQCEELLDGIVTATPERFGSLHDEVLRLGRLVEDLETLNTAQAAALRMDRGPVDLADIAGAAARSLRSRFDEAGIALEETLSPAIVQGDTSRLLQVVLNLLTNAAKYTRAGGHVQLEVGSDDGLATLTVTDDGPGIAEMDLPHVFERFWRGRDAGGTAGSGIGLAVVAELVRAHGGRTEVESTPGRGARFRVLLPAA